MNKICHIIAIPDENIYWNTSDEDITIDGQLYEGFSNAVTVTPMVNTIQHPQKGLTILFGVDGNDPVELDRFVNVIGTKKVRVSMIKFKR